jgi:thiamine pyrophosphate-dependent acetolactate synthase large subunit-like protein
MTALDRREVVRQLLVDRGEMVVVTGLGAPAYDLAATGDSPLDFPMWGAMGGAAMVGLGLAIAQPARPVMVLTGDGEMLMGMGSFATIAVIAPPNLRLVILDNERFGETGSQRTHTASGTDLAAVAQACGLADVRTVTTMSEVGQLRTELHRATGTNVAVIKISAEAHPRTLPPRDGPYLVHRMRAAMLGNDAALNG